MPSSSKYFSQSSSSSPTLSAPSPYKMRRTGYVFHEKYMWHDPGSLNALLIQSPWMESTHHWENVDTKRRFHSLVQVSGLASKLINIPPRIATEQEILRFHTKEYHDVIKKLSDKDGACYPKECVSFQPGGYEIAALSVGGVLAAVEALMAGHIDNAYCLVRPPGHHAEADRGMGFCIFNNIALAALHAKHVYPQKIRRIAIVDYDVHHGNGTQKAFWDDPDVLFISVHQDGVYPQDTGFAQEIGGDHAKGSTINIPLPPGSGDGAYDYTFQAVVIPAILQFKPDLILVSSGFDAADFDPLAAMLMSSEGFRNIAAQLIHAADVVCQGKILFVHEGGYSRELVPFCGLAVIETLLGERTKVVDPFLAEISSLKGQDCQPHQVNLIHQIQKLHAIPFHNTNLLTQEDLHVLDNIQAILDAIPTEEQRQRILKALL